MSHPFFHSVESYVEHCLDRLSDAELVLKYRELKGLEPDEDVPPMALMIDCVSNHFEKHYYNEGD